MNDINVRLKKTGRLPIGNMLERFKKHESDVYYDYFVIFNA